MNPDAGRRLKADTGAMEVRQAPTARCIAASFDGAAWDCYAVREMPDRHWAVLHNRGRTISPELRSGATELLCGLHSWTAARERASRLARDGFWQGTATDRRRPHVPRLAPLRVEADHSEGHGDPQRVGPVVRALIRTSDRPGA
jgi:hypothetical protein